MVHRFYVIVVDFWLLLLLAEFYSYFFFLRSFCAHFRDLIDCGGSRTKIINKVFLRWFVLWFYVRLRIESFSFLSFFSIFALFFGWNFSWFRFSYERLVCFKQIQIHSHIPAKSNIDGCFLYICVFWLSISVKVFFSLPIPDRSYLFYCLIFTL